MHTLTASRGPESYLESHRRRPRVGIMVGSLSAESINRELAEALVALLGERIQPVEVPLALPLYNRDLDDNPPDLVSRFKDIIRGLEGLIVVTPEFNRSMSAALKNAFEWGSRPYGQSVWTGLATGLVGASPGAIGTATAQQHVRNVLSFLDMPTLSQPEVYLTYRPGLFGRDGEILDDSTRAFLGGWADRFVEHLARHARVES